MEFEGLRCNVKQSDLPELFGIPEMRHLNGEMSADTKAAIDSAKKRHRSDYSPSDWATDGFAETDVLERLKQGCNDTMERIDFKSLDYETFVSKYVKGCQPAFIRGVPETWQGKDSLNWRGFYDLLGEREFKVGESDSGKTIRVKFKHFMEYLITQQDDSPLYLFESSFHRKERAPELVSLYQVPKLFQEDVMPIVGERARPPYRWMLVGPRRSGTTLHLDPLMTCAWNTSLQGHKLWVLFPNRVPKFIAKGMDFVTSSKKKEAINYFANILPQIKARESAEELGIIECIQRPGETIFVPGGWWHAVLNLDETIAITQNFSSPHSFQTVWRDFRSHRPKLSHFFLRTVKKKHPKIYSTAVALNALDQFIMFPDRPKVALGVLEDVTTTSIEYSSSSSGSSSSSYDSADLERGDDSSEDDKRKKGKTMGGKRPPQRKLSEDQRSEVALSIRERSRSLDKGEKDASHTRSELTQSKENST